MEPVPFTSVQTAITLFEQKIDRNKLINGGNKDVKEAGCSFVSCGERRLPEGKEAENGASRDVTDDLSTRLEMCEAERDKYKEKCRKARELFVEMGLLEAEDSPAILRGHLSRTEYLEQELLYEMVIAEYLYMQLKQLKEEIGGAASKCSGFSARITISMEEYEILIRQSKEAERNVLLSEMNKMKSELEAKNGEIRELNCRLEEMARRAAMAEKAEAAVEEHLNLWKELQQQRTSASGFQNDHSNKEQEAKKMQKSAFGKAKSIGCSFRPKRSSSMLNGSQSNYVLLGKLLNIKF
ncbi:hypothetical protein HPP92_005774 [Vanilla planifolia]|uniref:Uncharacterized protein n=1 Tax=Vanilla planifolia TaxID=51239 RepID=A0A835RM17_VANPL|nr:hypothetical protein HPP92_005774 [Vanilla planifolia]